MVDLQKLLDQMTIDEKIGQLTQYEANVFGCDGGDATGPRTKLDLTAENVQHAGSVLNYPSADAMRQIQDDHLANDRNKIPMLFMMDVIHGYRTIYPIPLALGCSFDTKIVEECSRMAAKEASAGGVQVTFTPMVDYVRDARWGRVMETCGEDAMLNGMMGAAQVRAIQGDDLTDHDHIAACVKHFAAYGGAEGGRDYNTVELSEHVLREYYLPAYKACIDAGVRMLMPSFNTLNGIPSVANPWLMQTILKDEWKFGGVVISDFDAVGELETHGVAADQREAAARAFQNGCDIEMCSSGYFHHLKSLIEQGVFTEQQLDAAVMRVLQLKKDLGLFADPYRGASNAKVEAVCLTPEHRAIARKAACASAVLLKNENVLPFSKDVKKVALIGPFADTAAILGMWYCNGNTDKNDIITVRQGVEAALPNADITVVQGCGNKLGDTDHSGFDEAVAAAAAADVVILCIGEPQDYSGEGASRSDLDIPGVQNELAKAVTQANPNTAVVLFNGRPLVLTELAKTAPALLEMWMPGTEGGHAVADLLFGEVNPSGKLSMSFPKALGQVPLYYNRLNTGRPKPVEREDAFIRYCSNYNGCGNLPLFPFGYGLSYSRFVYEKLSLSADTMTADETLTVTVTVRNDSDRAGFETVQLYMRDVVGSLARPVQQLIAFEKTYFEAGERKEITFKVTEPMLRFWNFEQKFVSEPGEFRLSVGCADNLLLTQTFVLK